MEPMHSRLETRHPPDHIIARDSTRTISNASLQAKVSALAEELGEWGVRVLALRADNSIDWLIVDLACQAASICLIPIPGFFSASQVEHVFTHSPVDAYLGDDPFAVETRLGNRLERRVTTLVGAMPLLLFQPAINAQPLPQGTGKVTFTSGSTGTPKGVCLANKQLQLQARALADAVALEAPRHLCLLPLSTLLENVAGLYSPLLSGGEVMLPSLAEIGFSGSSTLDPRKLLHTISRYQPDSMILTPQLLLLLVTAATSGWHAPASLRFVAVGGGKVAPGLLASANQLGIPAFEGYGLSECASVVSLNTPNHEQQGSCGKVLPHLKLTFEDGEIQVAGNAMLGYLGEPESWGQTHIRTGDLGYLDEQGYLHINGRSKNLLISSYGRNINPEWVESELLGQPLLSECVVLGDARPYLVALLTPRLPESHDDEIQRHIDQVNRDLPDYARIKSWYRLRRPLSGEQNLLTANGRPRRSEIAERYAPEIDSLYPETCLLESA